MLNRLLIFSILIAIAGYNNAKTASAEGQAHSEITEECFWGIWLGGLNERECAEEIAAAPEPCRNFLTAACGKQTVVKIQPEESLFTLSFYLRDPKGATPDQLYDEIFCKKAIKLAIDDADVALEALIKDAYSKPYCDQEEYACHADHSRTMRLLKKRVDDKLKQLARKNLVCVYRYFRRYHFTARHLIAFADNHKGIIGSDINKLLVIMIMRFLEKS
jgi:hypothetical protein